MTQSTPAINGSNTRRSWLWGLLWMALLLFGAVGVWSRLVDGHHAANYGSYVTWGLWVAAYIYFIGLSAGAFLISSLVYGFGVKKLETIGKLALFTAAITLLMALVSILFDLGHMERFYYIFLYADFSSMMAWMVWLYTAYFLLVLAELWLALRPDLVQLAEKEGLSGTVARLLLLGRTEVSEENLKRERKWLRVLALSGIPLAIAFHGGVGALFGTVVARPYWNIPLYPILFLTGALVSGGALLLAVVAFFWPTRDQIFRDTIYFLNRIVLGLLAFDLLLEWAEYSIPMWYGIGPEYHLLQEVLFGEFWYVFWVFHIMLGSAIPIALLLARPRARWAAAVAGLLVATTFLAVRLNIVIPGLIEPQLRGLADAYTDARLTFSYVPSLMEWQVVVFLVALAVALFYLGLRFLPLVARPAAGTP
ncbi:MAG: NrfD/PsrC family molybdoenzyme membrane anchor subunit [Rhodothermales bacterium]